MYPMLTSMLASCCVVLAGLPAAHATGCPIHAADHSILRSAARHHEHCPGDQVLSAGRVGSLGGLTVCVRCYPARTPCSSRPLQRLCSRSLFVPSQVPAAPMDACKCSQTCPILVSHGPVAALHQLLPLLVQDHRRPAPLFGLSARLRQRVLFPSPFSPSRAHLCSFPCIDVRFGFSTFDLLRFNSPSRSVLEEALKSYVS